MRLGPEAKFMLAGLGVCAVLLAWVAYEFISLEIRTRRAKRKPSVEELGLHVPDGYTVVDRTDLLD